MVTENTQGRIPTPETRDRVVKLYTNAIGDGFLLNRLRVWFQVDKPIGWEEWFPEALGNSSRSSFDQNCRELCLPRRFHKWLVQAPESMRRFLHASIVANEERHLIGMIGACHYLKSVELGVDARVDKRPGVQAFCYAAIVCGIDEVRKHLIGNEKRFASAEVEVRSRRKEIDLDVRETLLQTHYRLHNETPLSPFSDKQLVENAMFWQQAIKTFRLTLKHCKIHEIGKL